MAKGLALTVTWALVAAAGTAGAADETLVSGKFESGGFGGPYLKYSQVGDGWALLNGGRGGWIINHTLVLGGGGCGTSDGAYVESDAGERRRIELGYGGFELEYIVNSPKLLHYSFGLLVGGGSVDSRSEEGSGGGSESGSVFVAEPAANVELNVVSFFRLNLGLGYRLVAGSDVEGVTDGDLRGPAATLTFKFGFF